MLHFYRAFEGDRHGDIACKQNLKSTYFHLFRLFMCNAERHTRSRASLRDAKLDLFLREHLPLGDCRKYSMRMCRYVRVTVVWECLCEGCQGERYVWGWGGRVKCVVGICLSHHLVYYRFVSRSAVFLGNVVFRYGHATFYGLYEVFGGEIGDMGRG